MFSNMIDECVHSIPSILNVQGKGNAFETMKCGQKPGALSC